MAERLAFLLGKDPATSFGGDMTMFRTMRAIAAEEFDTEVICLSEQPAVVEPGVVRVAKPEISVPRLLAQSLACRRSLVHTRFDVDAMRDAVERSSADRFVVEHSYMAEAYLRARSVRPRDDLFVSTDVSESEVWRRTRGLAGRPEVRRIRRDEMRVARAARAVAGYDRKEMDAYRAAGIAARWLPMSLPPVPPVDVAATPPRLVLLGNRTWRPNAESAETMLRLWPRVAAGIPDAELLLVGPPAKSARTTESRLPSGVTDLGFVDDVDAVLGECRALAAPISVGAGVRVKLLEAASRGLPVAATIEAVGSIEASVGMTPAADEEAFVARCRALLLDVEHAVEAGDLLYAANARRWTNRVGQDAVLGWLSS